VSSDTWSHIDNKPVSIAVSRPAYCGRYALTLSEATIGGSWAVNFNRTVSEPGQSAAGVTLVEYPFMCMAYRIPSGTRAHMLVFLEGGIGWRSVLVTPRNFKAPFAAPPVAAWNAGEVAHPHCCYML
jgi:hypothetical protein